MRATEAHSVLHCESEEDTSMRLPRPLPVASHSASVAPMMAPGTAILAEAKNDGQAVGELDLPQDHGVRGAVGPHEVEGVDGGGAKSEDQVDQRGEEGDEAGDDRHGSSPRPKMRTSTGVMAIRGRRAR